MRRDANQGSFIRDILTFGNISKIRMRDKNVNMAIRMNDKLPEFTSSER